MCVHEDVLNVRKATEYSSNGENELHYQQSIQILDMKKK